MDEYINTDGANSWFGLHYILDLYEIKTQPRICAEVDCYLQLAAIEAGATILHSYIHDFGNGGFSGVVVLQESHISIHTWPEKKFAAVDIYMCGNCDPKKSIDYLIKVFQPERYEYVDIKRGLSPNINVEDTIILK